MAADETKVTYRAIATFTSLKKAVAAARKDLELLRKQEEKNNKSSADGSKRVAAAHRDTTKAVRSRTTSTKTFTNALVAQNAVLKENLDLQRKTGTAAQVAAAKVKTASSVTKDAAKETASLTKEHEATASAAKKAADAENALSNTVKKTAADSRNIAQRIKDWRTNLAKLNDEQRKFVPLSTRVHGGMANVLTSFRKLGNWRPRLTPPFVALLPLIAGVLALLTPLVSILSAVSVAGFAAGSSLLSLGGAAVAVVPMISGAVAAIASLLVGFKGIGGVFSKWKAARDVQTGGGGGETAAQAALRQLKAEERLADAQERALQAQEDLNDARREAVRRLEDLRKAVARASTDEADAAANAQLALENYYNVLADPGSTAGEKADALVRLQQAQQGVIDQQDEAIRNAEDLADAEAKGVEGSDQVVAAQRSLRDALRETRDATAALTAASGGGASAMNDFNTALAKLSPSAQAVVLALIGMQEAWESVQRNVQESFFSEIVDDMDDLASLLPTIETLLTKAGSAMGRFVSKFIQMVSSPEWKSDLGLISDVNVKLIDQAGRAVLALSTAWKDLIIAAGPFAEDLLTSFADLSESFSNIVADARESGSLASWLDTVYGRLQQWWRIVKNIAGTLFNYGAASADFGKWITDGLEATTKGWLEASEAAREEGSSFRTWLDSEELRGLLSEVKGLFGDFFSWLGRVSKDADVLTNAKDILYLIRTDLGPALSGLFDTLTKSGIGTDFVETLGSIVQSIAEIVENGGVEGLKVFFDVVSDFFQFIADLFKDPVWGPMITALAKFAGAMAALSFIGKFTGLFALFGWILKLAKSAGVAKLLTSIGGLKGLAGLAGGKPGAGTTPVAAGGPKGGGVGAGGGMLLAMMAIWAAQTTAATLPGVVDGGNKALDGAYSQDKDKVAEGITDSYIAFSKEANTGAILKLIDSIFNTTFKDSWDQFIEGGRENFERMVQDMLVFIEQALINIFSWWDTFSTGMTDFWISVGANFSLIWELVKQTGINMWNGVQAKAIEIWNTIRFTALAIWESVRITASNIWTSVQTTAINIWSGVKTAATNIWTTIQTTWTNGVNTIRNAFTTWISKLPFIGSAPTKKQGAIGGLVAQYLARGGTVRKLGQRGVNMDPKGTDTEPAMLTPGEYVLQKSRVDEYGADRIQAFNDGLISLTDLLASKNSDSGSNSGVGYFNGGGLAGDRFKSITPNFSSLSPSAVAQTMVDNSMNFGDIHIHNPRREAASESLPAAIRKVAYQGSGRRKPSPRLEKVDV